MNQNILDDIFHDKLRDQLEAGEVVVWDGKPQFSNYSNLVAVGFILVFLGFHLINSIYEKKYWLTTLFAIMVIFSLIQLFFRKKNTRYLVTNQRIIFQLPTKTRKTEIQSLPLNQLQKVIMKERVDKNGTLELFLKEPFKTKIQTTDIRNGYFRKNPTLELIDNVDEVRNHIKNSIQQLQ